MATALFIDSFSRNMEVSTVSITEVPGKGLVMRYGAKVGNLWQLTAEQEVFKPEMLILVAARGYAAQSSDGFVDVVVNNRGWNTRVQAQIVGIQGMPWMEHKSLRVCKTPIEVLVLRESTEISQLQTHANRKPGGGWHSNHGSADAARKAVELRSLIRPNSVFVVEGQSDYAQAWELATPFDDTEAFVVDWPLEHNVTIFPESTNEHRFELWENAALENPDQEYMVLREDWFQRAKYRRVTETDRQSQGSKPHEYEVGCFFDRENHVVAWVKNNGYLRRPGSHMEHLGPWIHREVEPAEPESAEEEN